LIKNRLKGSCLIQVGDIPYTLSGKKMETAVKKIFMGQVDGKGFAPGAMRNPECLQEYIAMARRGTPLNSKG